MTLSRPNRPRAARLPLAAALLLLASAAAAQDFRPELTVVQLNDVYRIDAVENGNAGGIGRTVTLVERLERETRGPVMVLHAGDAIAPSLESRYFAGLQMVDALNFLHARAPLVFVPGNHEFDERSDTMFAGAVRASRFPWLAGNLAVSTRDAAVDRAVGRDTVIVTAGGMRLGVFTLTFLDSRRDWAAADSAFVRIAEEQIRRLERGRADVIVGLTHLGHETDREIARLRRRHPRFVWIAGGHEHFLIHDPLTDTTAAITKGDSNARRVWRVALGRRGRRAAMRADSVVLDASVPVDSAYQREVTDRWQAELRAKIPFLDVPIGRSETPLDAAEETVRNAESAWGSWLADQMRTAFPTVPTDAAVLNGGAIRIDDVVQGELRWEHLARTFGFPTRVAIVRLRGRDLRERVLERSVSGGRGEGRFLQVSGLRVRFDRSRPEGRRILDAQVQREGGWAPIADDSVYTLAVPDYLFGGGDGYPFPEIAVERIPPGPDLKLIAFDRLTALYAAGRAIAPRVEGRLVDETPRDGTR
ncbi:MAG TPA: 5'-nucleotidase C-terminal domain-containing protein [Longimicrobium sp.]